MVQIRSRNDTVLPGGERRYGKAAGLDRTHQRGCGESMKTWQTPPSTVDSAANATCYNLIESDYLPAPSTSTAISLNHQRLTATDEHKKIRFPAHARTVLREIYQTSTQQAHVCCAKRVLATSPATAPATAPATTPASSAFMQPPPHLRSACTLGQPRLSPPRGPPPSRHRHRRTTLLQPQWIGALPAAGTSAAPIDAVAQQRSCIVSKDPRALSSEMRSVGSSPRLAARALASRARSLASECVTLQRRLQCWTGEHRADGSDQQRSGCGHRQLW